MTCEEARNQLSAYLDHELSELEAARLEAHLAQCPDCSALLEAYKFIDTGLTDLIEPVPEGFSQRVMDNLPKQSKPKHRRFAYGGFTAVAAVAAVLVLAIAAGKLKLPSMGASSSDSDMFAYSTEAAASEAAMEKAGEPAMAAAVVTEEEAAPAAMAPAAQASGGELTEEAPAAGENFAAAQAPAMTAAPSAAYFAAGPTPDEPNQAQTASDEESVEETEDTTAEIFSAALYAARDGAETAEVTAVEEEALESDLDAGAFAPVTSFGEADLEAEEAEPELAAQEPAPEPAPAAANDMADSSAEREEPGEEAIPEAPVPQPVPPEEPAAAAAMPEEAAAETIQEPLTREDVFGTGQELILVGPTNLTADLIAQNSVAAGITVTGVSSGALPQPLAELAYQQLEDGPLYHEDTPEDILALYEALDGQLPTGMTMTLDRSDDVYGSAYLLLIP